MNNITKTFATWAAFLEYVEELKNWLFDNNYVDWWRPNMLNSSRPKREEIFENRETFIADLKEKGIYEQYVEFFNNCQKYLDENIVVRNRDKNVRYQKFDYCFRFYNQKDGCDFDSIFVWTLLDNRDYFKEFGFSVIPQAVFELPNNPGFYELGVCWYCKRSYTDDDLINGRLKEYTTEDAIKEFIEATVKMTPHKKGLPKLACVDTEDVRSSYSGPGPVQHWTVGVSGFILTPTNNGKYKIVSGTESMKNISVNLFFDDKEYVNQKEKRFQSEKKISTLDTLLCNLGLNRDEVKTITWYNKKGKTHIINNNGVVSIFCYHEGLNKEFQSLRGNLVMNKPYDPSVWGWT